MIPVTVIVPSSVTSIVRSGRASSAMRCSWSMPIEKVDTMCAAMACALAGRSGSFFMVIDSLKCLLTSGARASNSLTERSTVLDKTWLTTDDVLLLIQLVP